jgi:Fe-S cluster assembly protein SufB
MSQSYSYIAPKGLNKEIIETISAQKNEPAWMLQYRLQALALFEKMPMPTWGPDLSGLPIDDLHYYLKPLDEQKKRWDEVPENIKNTFETLGIPQAEKRFLAGVGAQFESEIIYKSLKKKWELQGVVFLSLDEGLRTYPDLFKQYFGTVIPAHDNKFAALNAAVWSGGSFIYVPKGVRIEAPLQAYFRINTASMGQFERTLIIADSGSFVHYVEGCSAPVANRNSLHSAVVELIACDNAHIRYTTIQNWSSSVYNLVTKRAHAYQDSTIEWVDGNFGSKVTMKYPAIILKERGAKGQIISIAVAGKGQHQDSGGKIIHLAPHTTSNIVAKSISKQGGRSSYRGLLKIIQGAHSVTSRVTCQAMLFDEGSRSDTYPTIKIDEHRVDTGHEASVSKISDDQLFYTQSRGLSESQGRALIVNGFIDAFVKELPMEYAVEINRLVALEMEGSIG